MSEEMYKEIILDHYKNPRNKGVFPDAEVSAEDYNPVCGDRIRIDIMIGGNAEKKKWVNNLTKIKSYQIHRIPKVQFLKKYPIY